MGLVIYLSPIPLIVGNGHGIRINPFQFCIVQIEPRAGALVKHVCCVMASSCGRSVVIYYYR